jgi:uncharacterized protein (TIGR00645 family)
MPKPKSSLETVLERILFASRWLMAPIYLGLIAALGGLIVVFFQELIHDLPIALGERPEHMIILALALIDLSLAGNLVIIVILSGYENFVSRIDAAEEDRPDWMGRVDYSGMKLKLIASVAAISAVSLLKAVLKMSESPTQYDQRHLAWLVAIHMTFVVSGLLLAVMDWVSSKTVKH